MKKMQEIQSRIWGFRPSDRLIALAASLLLIVGMIPLIRMVPYAIPWYDDYNYGGFAQRMMKELPGLRGALVGAAECVKTQWYAWQGTYSSVFFMALMPGIWGEDKYFLGPLFLLLLSVTAILVLLRVLVKDVLKAEGASCIALQALTALMVIMLLHSSHEGLFWYNAGIHYLGMHSFGMLFLAAVIRLLYCKSRGARVVLLALTILGATVTAGANFVTALQMLLVLLTIVLFAFLLCRKRVFLLLPAVCTYLIGFFCNLAAPGNSVRARNYVGWGMPPVKAVWYSFREAFQHLGEFTGEITVAVLLLFVPIIWRLVQKSKCSFRLPGLVLAWSVCLYAAGFTPSLYSLGHAGLARTLNAVKITYQLLLVINEVYWLGWLWRVLQKKQEQRGVRRILAFRACWWFYCGMGVIMLYIFSISPNQAGHYSSYGAYYYVHTGEAYNFHQEYLKRVEALSGEEAHVVLEPYHFKPWLLCTGDLSSDPHAEPNRAVAGWYGKESVIVRTQERAD